MTSKELERNLIKLIKLKEGSQKLTPNTLEGVAFNNNQRTVAVLDYIKQWADMDDYQLALEKLLEDKSVNFLLKDLGIISFLAYKIKIMGKVRLYQYADPKMAPKVMFFNQGRYLTGFIVKKDYVYPLVQTEEGLTNKGQKSLRVRTNPHYKLLRQLTYQYEIHL